MSTKSNKSSTSTKNSFGILGTLEDSQPIPSSKAKKANNVSVEAKQSISAAAVKSQAPTTQKKKETIKKNTGNTGSAKASSVASTSSSKDTLPASKSKETAKESCAQQTSLVRMMIFAILMLVLPIGAYYWCVQQSGFDLGEIKSAMVAVLVVNILLFVYIVMAMFEDSKSRKAKKD